MPLSFVYYYVAEQWRLVQQKMLAVGKIYYGGHRITLAFKLVKNADLSLWPNAISE
jgi:hypothetical protein